MADEGITCDACGLPPYGAALDRDASGLPQGWYRHRFGRREFTLCEVCGSIRQFKGGVSAYLQEALGLPPNAMPDFASRSEPGSGLHRLRIRKPADGAKGGDKADQQASPGTGPPSESDR